LFCGFNIILCCFPVFSALIGELRADDTLSMTVAGSVAYTAQTPWIRNATLRDNILFGKPFDQAWYDKVIEACALSPDFSILPAGDRTEIGAKVYINYCLLLFKV
jgi:ABC-type transport system involved in cytochrome bd biosynthesis fused ATPase/permease subunit